MLRLKFSKEELSNENGNGGLDIRIPGFACNPEAPDDGQIFIEYYQGQLRINVWNGKGDPETITLAPFSGNYDYLVDLFKSKKDNIDNIWDWKFIWEEDFSHHGFHISFLNKSLNKEIIITPTELWGDLWDEEKEGMDNRNKINTIIYCHRDSVGDFTDWKKEPSDLKRDYYQKFVKFVWTGNPETDLLNFYGYAVTVIREVEEKFLNILCSVDRFIGNNG